MARTPKQHSQAPSRTPPLWVCFGVLFVVVLAFWWAPLTDPETTLHWDAIDYHLGAQSYFADEVKAGRLPVWTDFQFSGFPFLADPQVGAWYPLNWPFFLIGISEKSLVAELWLHALLASFGAFLLARLWLTDAWAAVTVGLLYSLSGFFAAHASHIGMFQAAAWLPLLLWSLHRASDLGSFRWSLLTGAFAGMMFLAGHFQTALYCFLAMALYAGARRQKAAVRVLAITAVVTILLTAVQWLPGLTLVRESIRSTQQYANTTNAALAPATLLTLLIPNYFGAAHGTYTGPPDVTQFYFYGGLALVPLAVWGALRDRRLLVVIAVVAAPCLWYALGPGGGLYLLLAQVPGLKSVRGPVHIWFVIALGLALLAGAGLQAVPVRWVRFVILGVTFLDLGYWNSWTNELPYLRTSYATEYGEKLEAFDKAVTANLPPLMRFHSPVVSPYLGPLTGPLLTRTAVTYGYNPLALSKYDEFLLKAKDDPRRLNVLGAALQINPKTGQLERNPAAEGRFVLPGGSIVMKSVEQGRYAAAYSAGVPGLLRVAVPWFPGWTASVNGAPAQVESVDGALMGVRVPAGSGEVRLEFHLPGLALGTWISGLTVLGLLVLGWWSQKTDSRSHAGT